MRANLEKSQFLIICAVTVVVLFLVSLNISFKNRSNVKLETSPSPVASTSDGAVIAVSDQQIKGTIKLDSVLLPYGAFIVIHKVYGSGQPGLIVGHSQYLAPSRYHDLEIKLEPGISVKVGDKLIATVHPDVNHDEKYSSDDAKVILKERDDQIIAAKFSAK